MDNLNSIIFVKYLNVQLKREYNEELLLSYIRIRDIINSLSFQKPEVIQKETKQYFTKFEERLNLDSESFNFVRNYLTKENPSQEETTKLLLEIKNNILCNLEDPILRFKNSSEFKKYSLDVKESLQLPTLENILKSDKWVLNDFYNINGLDEGIKLKSLDFVKYLTQTILELANSSTSPKNENEIFYFKLNTLYIKYLNLYFSNNQ
jgi:hypothetical protein